jgi:hypothetical protein
MNERREEINISFRFFVVLLLKMYEYAACFPELAWLLILLSECK